MDTAGAAGDLDSVVRDGRGQVSALQAAAERENASMNHWDGTVTELERLKVPSDATIQRFSKQFTEASSGPQSDSTNGTLISLSKREHSPKRTHGSKRGPPRPCEARSQPRDEFATTR